MIQPDRRRRSAFLGGLAACLLAVSVASHAQPSTDQVLLDMAQAYRKGDRKNLTALLPAARGHILEPWAAYWELSARLDAASPSEIRGFFERYAGTYQEDRLRNDYLLQLARRQEWGAFSTQLGAFRMRDDVQVRCYALWAQYLVDRQPISQAVTDLWWSQKDADEGCTGVMGQLYRAEKIEALTLWQRARWGMETGKLRMAFGAVNLMNPQWADTAITIFTKPEKFLEGKVLAVRPRTRELVTLALVRLAMNDPAAARAQVSQLRWRTQLTAEERSWIWAVIAKQSAQNLSLDALDDFAHAQDHRMLDDHLAWKARAALRAQNWPVVLIALSHMSAAQQAEATWVYWRAKALQMQPQADRVLAQTLYQSIAGPIGFYEQLALAELNQTVQTPAPHPIEPSDADAARQNPGLQRALAAVAIGLRSEGVREWNYTTNLHNPGGMSDGQLRAAAKLACDHQLWDRCISASDKTKQVVDWSQRYPTPLKSSVVPRSQEIALDPAYVYGLMRQESRFVMTARSGVGASGLMQVMPATARWTAKKMGMTDFSTDQLNQESTNIAIGTFYLKLVMDEFEGHVAMAAGAYNAGPSRVRFWRLGPVLDAPVWIENIPFAETRDYVKKVVANAVVYSALLTGQPQSIKTWLPPIGPRKSESPIPDGSLP